MEWPVVSSQPLVQAFYEVMREEGESHLFSEMCALRQAPRANTDREFFAGLGTLGDQYAGQEILLSKIIATAQKHGYNPGVNDVYCPTIAKFQGDPEAFVSPTGGRGHIKKVIESRGWECDGSVKVKGSPREVKDAGLAPDLVNKAVGELARHDPKIKKASKREQKQEAIRQFGVK